MRKLFVLAALALVVGLMALSGGGRALAGTGFDGAGYNRTARIFNGTGWSWCMDKVGNAAWCSSYLGPYANDKLLMKWNAEWDRGNAEGWSNPPYDAWENNEWNGRGRNGSGAVWHYNIAWVGPCGPAGTPLPDGGYCIWGQFEVLMDHGTDPSFGPGHIFFALATPAGYGAH